MTARKNANESESGGVSPEESEILALFEAGDRALISGDPAELERIYAEDYVQCDDQGNFRTKQELIHSLTSGQLRFLSMTSTGRCIRTFGDFAVVHGSERDEVEQSGQCFVVSYLYMDVVVRREGRWLIVGSQLSRLKD